MGSLNHVSTPPAMRTSSATAQQQIAAASNGAARQRLARDASLAESVHRHDFVYAAGEREQIEAENREVQAALASDQRYQAIAAEIDALREAEAEADPAPRAYCAWIDEAELAGSETALEVYRSLCRADRAALPEIAPAHQRAAHLSAILARLARADLAALIHARLRTIHAAITARILRAGRAVAATSAAPASLC